MGTAKRNAERELAKREINRRKSSGFWDYKIKDMVEPAMVMASSALAEPIAGLVGLAGLASGVGVDAASGAIARTRDALTYEPRLDKTKEDLAALAYNLEPIGDAMQNLSQVPGDYVYEKTGSPLMGAMAYSAVPAFVEMLGLKGAKGLGGAKYEMGDISDLTNVPGGKQRGIFAGVKAKNADMDMHAKAVSMEKSGAPREDIWQETGWYKGADGEWRFEISDNTAQVNVPREASGQKKADAYEIMNRLEDMTKDDILQEMDLMDFKGTPEEYIASEMAHGKAMLADTSKSDYPIEAVMDHPELLGVDPSLKKINTQFRNTWQSDEGASYSPGVDNIRIGRAEGDPRSAMLHEVQHALQEREGFSTGGSPDTAKRRLGEAKQSELSSTSGSMKKYLYELQDDSRSVSIADYVNRLDILSKADSIKPSSITKLSDFYEFADKIREKLGAMPKKTGAQRDEWLRGAAAYIRNKNYDKMTTSDKYFLDMANADPKSFASNKRKIEREMKKVLPDVQKNRAIVKRYEELEGLDDFDLYQRLGGEVEARNVQTRLDMTPEERRAKPPWETLDVPEGEIILNGPSFK